MLEGYGIATALVSLVSSQSEPASPPRVLWVPFELGRPMGAPLEPEFQASVLGELIDMFALLRPADGGSVLREFVRDAPASQPRRGWQGPDLSGAASLAAEVTALADVHTQFVRVAGRSTVGLSGLTVLQAAEFVASFEQGGTVPVPLVGVSLLVQFRFAVDDLKAFYLEAASAGDAGICAVQLQDWLWNQTRLGGLLRAYRAGSLDGADKRRELVGGKFLVPRDWVV